jgi:hypothetical protein
MFVCAGQPMSLPKLAAAAEDADKHPTVVTSSGVLAEPQPAKLPSTTSAVPRTCPSPAASSMALFEKPLCTIAFASSDRAERDFHSLYWAMAPRYRVRHGLEDAVKVRLCEDARILQLLLHHYKVIWAHNLFPGTFPCLDGLSVSLAKQDALPRAHWTSFE